MKRKQNTEKELEQARDAGIDLAHDLISQYPKWTMRDLIDEASGCSLDLCGGDEAAADYAFDAACATIKAHFKNKQQRNEKK